MVVYNDSLDSLKTFFSNKKTIEVKFSKQVERELLKDFNITEFTPLSANIEVELTDSDIKSEVFKIFRALPVQDINISNIGIEEVIKQIYCA